MSDDIVDYDPQDFPEALAWFKEARDRHRRKCEQVADLKAIIGRQEEKLHQAEMCVAQLDAENEKALKLYTSLGYTIEQESIVYELKL